MKRSAVRAVMALVLGLSMIGSVTAAASAPDNPPEAGYPHESDRFRGFGDDLDRVPEPPAELRGTYVVSWRQMTSPESIEQVVADAAANNFNALFVQVRARGDAYYRSNIVPRSEELEGQDPDFDPLAHVIDAAAEHDIEVHAWPTPWSSGARPQCRRALITS